MYLYICASVYLCVHLTVFIYIRVSTHILHIYLSAYLSIYLSIYAYLSISAFRREEDERRAQLVVSWCVCRLIMYLRHRPSLSVGARRNACDSGWSAGQIYKKNRLPSLQTLPTKRSIIMPFAQQSTVVTIIHALAYDTLP